MTSDQGTLFEEYPAKPKRRKKKAACCEIWEGFLVEREEMHQAVPPHLVWFAVHRFAHGRVPFSVETLATKATTTESTARTVIRGAVEREWISPVLAEHPGQLPEPVWIGRLEKKGR